MSTVGLINLVARGPRDVYALTPDAKKILQGNI